LDTPVARPRAPATRRLAAIAEVSGRGLYGCKNSKITFTRTIVYYSINASYVKLEVLVSML
jgi:hypothetical protein